jgi:outer membrane protein assembly factor BamE (lipoprotein component of BamABCDE complex)
MKNNGIAWYRLVMAALAVSLLVAGCSSVTVGRPFDYEAFASQIRVGSSGLKQVEAALGPPIGKGLVAEADGSLYDQWTYYYGRGDLNNAEKNRFKLLQIRFGKDGKVASYNWSGELSGAPAGASAK